MRQIDKTPISMRLVNNTERSTMFLAMEASSVSTGMAVETNPASRMLER
jgi:hypothetical protein